MNKTDDWEYKIDHILAEHSMSLLTNQPFSYEFHDKILKLISEAREDERKKIIMEIDCKSAEVYGLAKRDLWVDDLLESFKGGE